MPRDNEFEPDTIPQEEATCTESHVDDLDEGSRRFLSMFSTVRSKVEDVAKAESDIKRFELSIEQERKRFQKQLESAKVALKNARVQVGVELSKVDQAGFSKVAQLIKDDNAGA